MDEIVKWQLRQISNVWNYYILNYKFCSKQIKFTDDVKSNYFGDILHYFFDTFTVILKQKESTTFSYNFEQTISFLQAIYVQQDFVEELLHIFKCNIDKGVLKKDLRYSINREVRNELVGHPVRKTKNSILLSSAIFSNNTSSSQIAYLRYHIDNNYKSEEIIHLKSDIIKRHLEFLHFYFQIIIEKLKKNLRKYFTKLEEVEGVQVAGTFPELLKVVSIYFEEIYNNDYLYNQLILLEVYNKRLVHKRYQNGINLFMNELRDSLAEKKRNILELQTATYIPNAKDSTVKIFIRPGKPIKQSKRQKVSYHYEMSKLVSKKDYANFTFFMSLLRDKCKNKKTVLNELTHMENNRENDLEYYSAYHLVNKLLKNE